MFQRLWVWILAPDTGWTWHFFTLICCKNCIVCLKKTKNKRKRGRGLLNLLKKHSGTFSTWRYKCILCHKSCIKIYPLVNRLVLWQKSFIILVPGRRAYKLSVHSSRSRICTIPSRAGGSIPRSRPRTRAWSCRSSLGQDRNTPAGNAHQFPIVLPWDSRPDQQSCLYNFYWTNEENLF